MLTHTNFSGPGRLENSRFVESESQLEINYIGKEYEVLNKELIEEELTNTVINSDLGETSLFKQFIKIDNVLKESQTDMGAVLFSKKKKKKKPGGCLTTGHKYSKQKTSTCALTK